MINHNKDETIHHIMTNGTMGMTNMFAIILKILNCHINNNKNGVIAMLAHRLGMIYFFMMISSKWAILFFQRSRSDPR